LIGRSDAKGRLAWAAFIVWQRLGSIGAATAFAGIT